MRTALAVAVAACAFSGSSRAEEIIVLDGSGVRITVLAESIRLFEHGALVGGTFNWTNLGTGETTQNTLLVTCKGKRAGEVMIKTPADALPQRAEWHAKGEPNVLDALGRAMCVPGAWKEGKL